MILNPLAFPKGVKLNCEICKKPARLRCMKCCVTYYCTEEHQKSDWSSLHEKICLSLKTLRQPGEFSPSAEEREKRADELLQKKKRVLEITEATTRRLLFEGKHERAFPAALHLLTFSIDMYGIDSPDIVKAYVLLGETNIGLKNFDHAEVNLAKAEWIVLKTQKVGPALKSELFRNLGLLHLSKDDLQEAMRFFAEDVYNSSEAYGPEDICTTGGYFQMANIFEHQGKIDVAASLYSEVINIWQNHLDYIVKFRTKPPPLRVGVGPGVIMETPMPEKTLSEAQEAYALKMLTSIYVMYKKKPHCPSEDMFGICHTLAMLYFLSRLMKKAKTFGQKAQEAAEHIDGECISRRKIAEFMNLLEHEMKS